MKTDTIAAIATGLSNAGISMIRISGDQAFEIIDRIYIIQRKKSYHSLWLYRRPRTNDR